MNEPEYSPELLERLISGELIMRTVSWPDDWYCEVDRNKDWYAYNPNDTVTFPPHSGIEHLYHELDDLGWEGDQLITGWDWTPLQKDKELVAFEDHWKLNDLGRHYIEAKLFAAQKLRDRGSNEENQV
jgi:hypothetical protein